MRKILMMVCTAVAITSCYKADLQSADILGAGLVEITIPAPTVPEGSVAPTDFTVKLEDQEITVATDGTMTFPDRLLPGEYTVYVYNEPGSVTYAKSAGDVIASVATSEGVVENLTEALFFGAQLITVEDDKVTASAVALSPITRELLFNLKIVDGDPTKIESVTASLSGVANQWLCVADAPYGVSVSIAPALKVGAPISRSEEVSEYLTASVMMMGINGAKQELSVKVVYKDGTEILSVSDVSKELASFNADKSIVMTLSGDISIPKESGQNGTIENWVVVEGDDVVNVN